jgi:hypothetical protein
VVVAGVEVVLAGLDVGDGVAVDPAVPGERLRAAFASGGGRCEMGLID